MNDCVRYRFCYGTFGIIRQFFSMITLFPPFLPGIVPHKRYGILQLADYERSPSVAMDTKKKYMLLSYRSTYKTLDDLNQQEISIGGLRINPVTNIATSTT